MITALCLVRGDMDGQISLSDLPEQIYIKSLFSGWREATREQARRWATHIVNHSTGRFDREEEINSRLRGITYAELMKKEPEHTTAADS
jgi:hypothetical protein